MTFTFRPANTFTDRRGLFVALVGGPNSGKTYSAMRLARGIAGPTGRIAVLDTEGGRVLNLKEEFGFDAMVLSPPHRPERYAEAAQAAEEQSYDVLVIDSFTAEWRGVGGVLDWMEEELDRMCGQDLAKREKQKARAAIRPKMAHKLMVAGLLDRRIPIIFSTRGEVTFDPKVSKEAFKPLVAPGFLFEVTVSFRLSTEHRGYIDLTDPTTYKMEGVHKSIFRHGEQLSEAHGRALDAWARGGTVAQPVAGATVPAIDAEVLAELIETGKGRAEGGTAALRAWLGELGPMELAAVKAANAGLMVIAKAADAARAEETV